MTHQDAEDCIRRVGVEPTEKLIDQFIWAYYKGRADSGNVAPHIGFMCNTDFHTELPYGQDGRVYSTLKIAKKKLECADSCGLVKVAIVELERVSEGTDNQQ